MYWLFGRDEKQIPLDFRQMVDCPLCGKKSRYKAFMFVSVFCFFFIPLIRWDQHYYVRTGCCHKQCELNPKLGRLIRKGKPVTITAEDLTEEVTEVY